LKPQLRTRHAVSTNAGLGHFDRRMHCCTVLS
jgi:hypothetical protein